MSKTRKTKKQNEIDKSLKPKPKHLKYKILKQKSSLLVKMQNFKTMFDLNDPDSDLHHKVIKNAHKLIATDLANEFLNIQDLKDQKFKARKCNDWGINWEGNKILVMAIARAGLVGAKSFAETIGANLGYVVTEKDSNGEIFIKEYNTLNIDRNKIQHIIYFDPIISSGETLAKVIKFGIIEKGFCNPKISIFAFLTSADSINLLDNLLDDKQINQPIDVIVAQQDWERGPGYLKPGSGDAGDKLFGIQVIQDKQEVINKYREKYKKHNLLAQKKFVDFNESDSEICPENDLNINAALPNNKSIMERTSESLDKSEENFFMI